jgi:hypothetical protein
MGNLIGEHRDTVVNTDEAKDSAIFSTVVPMGICPGRDSGSGFKKVRYGCGSATCDGR